MYPQIPFGMVDFGGLLRSFGVDWHLLVVQSLNFILVVFLLYRFGFKSILRSMDERREKIASGLAYAEKMQNEMAAFTRSRVERVASAKKEAEDIVKAAKIDAKSLFERGKEETRQLADNMIADAGKEISRHRERMLKDAKAEIGTLVVDVARNVLATHITGAERDKYIASAERALLSEDL